MACIFDFARAFIGSEHLVASESGSASQLGACVGLCLGRGTVGPLALGRRAHVPIGHFLQLVCLADRGLDWIGSLFSFDGLGSISRSQCSKATNSDAAPEIKCKLFLN